MADRLASYSRIHRRNAGLNQRELGIILGYDDEGAVSRHERFRAVPPLLMALAYEATFRVPVSEIFAGFYEAVAQGVEERLTALERKLGEQSANGPQAAATARKLEWLYARRSMENTRSSR